MTGTTVRPDGLLVDEAEGDWGAALAVFSPDRLYRYALARTWDAGLPACAFLMLNPSTADAFRVDPTVRRCLGFARDWGCGSLLVLNVFALRSTDPTALYGHLDPTGPENDRLIAESLRLWQPSHLVAGWGKHAHALDEGGYRRPRRQQGPVAWVSRAQEVVAMHEDRLLALHVNGDGSPKHPLYIAADAIPRPYPLDPAAKAVYAGVVTEERPSVADRSTT